MPTIDMDAAPSGAGLPSLSGDLSAGEHLEVPLDQLVLGENVRTDVVVTDEFVDDIREHGVEVEILARRDVVGQLVVLDGQTRCLAAAKAGLKTVPVKVVDGVGDDEERIARQYRLNEHRTPLTAAQKVAAAERLALFGRTPKAIARKLHVPEADVAAALAVAQSKAAKKQLAEPEVDAEAARGWLADEIPVVKSWKHHDGEPCFGGGWFIVTADLPTGQVSNHYPADAWDHFKVPEVDAAPQWDGHTPADAAKRLRDHVLNADPIIRRCRKCGCTDNEACLGGCWWVAHDLCSACGTDDRAFVPVAGHPDDDECTYRTDGTDDTYCGRPRADHLGGDHD